MYMVRSRLNARIRGAQSARPKLMGREGLCLLVGKSMFARYNISNMAVDLSHTLLDEKRTAEMTGTAVRRGARKAEQSDVSS